MTSGRRSEWDRLALIASLVGAIAGVGYLWLVAQQGDGPVVWFLAGLVVSVLLAVYGAATAVPLRTAALMVSGAVLVVLGFLGIFSVGLPILVAGALALTAAARSRRQVRS